MTRSQYYVPKWTKPRFRLVQLWKSEARTYKSWGQMLSRCRNPKAPDYPSYGGKGITVCERWHKFSNFLEDMGSRPPGTSIDRWPDPHGNYEPSNCRWATPKEQSNNKRPWGTVAAKKFPKNLP